MKITLFFVFLIALCSAVSAATLNLTHTDTGHIDSRFDDDNPSSDLVGATTTFSDSIFDNTGEIAIFGFNISSIPSGATITGATLYLWASIDSNENLDVWLFREQEWNETSVDAICGGGGGVACAALWTNWTTKLVSNYNGDDTDNTRDLIGGLQSGVQTELDASNSRVSFILNNTGDTTDYYRWHTFEHATADQRPYLIVNYTTQTDYYFCPNGNDANNGTGPGAAKATITEMNGLGLNPGDTILFCKNGVWNLTEDAFPSLTSGDSTGFVTYTNYGSGQLPQFRACYNMSNPGDWENYFGDYWITTGLYTTQLGVVILNNTIYQNNFDLFTDINEQGECWYNATSDKEVMYSPAGNPGDYYGYICPSKKDNIFDIGTDAHHQKFIGLDMRYGGDHGLVGTDNHNIEVYNCSFNGIGGAIYSGVSQRGNCIQLYSDAKNNTVMYNNFTQCYDAAFTMQSSDTTEGHEWNNTFSYNIVTNSRYGFEFFNANAASTTWNNTVTHNTFFNLGMGFGKELHGLTHGRPFRLSRDTANSGGWNISDNLIYNWTYAAVDLGSGSGVNWKGAEPYLDYNLYFQHGASLIADWDNIDYWNLAAFAAAEPVETQGIEAYHEFVDVDNWDFRPVYNSSACGNASDGGDIGAIPCVQYFGQPNLTVTNLINHSDFYFNQFNQYSCEICCRNDDCGWTLITLDPWEFHDTPDSISATTYDSRPLNLVTSTYTRYNTESARVQVDYVNGTGPYTTNFTLPSTCLENDSIQIGVIGRASYNGIYSSLLTCINTTGQHHILNRLGTSSTLIGTPSNYPLINDDDPDTGVCYHFTNWYENCNTGTLFTTINEISLFKLSNESSKGIVPYGSGVPFHTNVTNPQLHYLLQDECINITWWVNATGTVGSSYIFYVNASPLFNSSNAQTSSMLNIDIINLPTVSKMFYAQNTNSELIPSAIWIINGTTHYSNPTTVTLITNRTYSYTVYDSLGLYVQQSGTHTVTNDGTLVVTMQPSIIGLHFSDAIDVRRVFNVNDYLNITTYSSTTDVTILTSTLPITPIYFSFNNISYSYWQFYEFINMQDVTINESIYVLEEPSSNISITVQNYMKQLLPDIPVRAYVIINNSYYLVGQRLSNSKGKVYFGLDKHYAYQFAVYNHSFYDTERTEIIESTRILNFITGTFTDITITLEPRDLIQAYINHTTIFALTNARIYDLAEPVIVHAESRIGNILTIHVNGTTHYSNPTPRITYSFVPANYGITDNFTVDFYLDNIPVGYINYTVYGNNTLTPVWSYSHFTQLETRYMAIFGFIAIFIISMIVGLATRHTSPNAAYYAFNIGLIFLSSLSAWFLVAAGVGLMHIIITAWQGATEA